MSNVLVKAAGTVLATSEFKHASILSSDSALPQERKELSAKDEAEQLGTEALFEQPIWI